MFAPELRGNVGTRGNGSSLLGGAHTKDANGQNRNKGTRETRVALPMGRIAPPATGWRPDLNGIVFERSGNVRTTKNSNNKAVCHPNKAATIQARRPPKRIPQICVQSNSILLSTHNWNESRPISSNTIIVCPSGM